MLADIQRNNLPVGGFITFWPGSPPIPVSLVITQKIGQERVKSFSHLIV
jgi:hypothetical protein